MVFIHFIGLQFVVLVNLHADYLLLLPLVFYCYVNKQVVLDHK